MTDEERAVNYKKTYPISEVLGSLSQMGNIMTDGYNFLLEKISQAYIDGMRDEREFLTKKDEVG